MKICGKCKESRPLTDFYKNKKSKDGHQAACKDCSKAYRREWYANNPEKAKSWSKRNRDKLLERYPNYDHEWYLKYSATENGQAAFRRSNEKAKKRPS